MRLALVAMTLLAAGTALGDPRHAVKHLAFTTVRGEPVSLADERGRVVVLVTASRYTRKTAERVGDALRAPAERGVTVVFVVDFMGIPRMFHGYAQRKIIERTNHSPIHYVIARDDRVRSVVRASPKKRVDILVLDRAGDLRGRFDGATDLGRALDLIRDLDRTGRYFPYYN